jgi:hypothetical protein
MARHARLADQEPLLDVALKAFRSGLMTPPGEADRKYRAEASPMAGQLPVLAELETLLRADVVRRQLLLSDRHRRQFLDLSLIRTRRPADSGRDSLVASGTLDPKPEPALPA